MLPVWITDLPRMKNWDELYVDLINQHNNTNQYETASVFTVNNTGVWDKLYDQFFNKCQEIFGPINLHENNSRQIWCYVANKDHYMGGIHNHTQMGTIINGVYYFSVPESPYYDGTITFYNDNKEFIWTYKPREQDLILFPGYLNHEPKQINTEKYRIAINMEIICDWPFPAGV